MNPLYTSSIGQKIPNVFIDYGQEITMAMRMAAYNEFYTAYGMVGGIEARVWQLQTNSATATIDFVDEDNIATIDTGVNPNTVVSTAFDWSDRLVFGIYRGLGGANRIPGQANDYLYDAVAPTLFWGYLGQGALDGASAQVTAGNPPVPAAGTSWAIQITTNVWLYLDATDGRLKFYNDTGALIYAPTIILFATAPTGARP
jgi:hypothetical protein